MRIRLGIGTWRVILMLVSAQALVLLVYLGIEAARRRNSEPPFRYERVDGPRLPEVSLQSSDGSMRAVTTHQRRAILLHFWATWCPPCREDLPGLLELQKDQSIGGLDVVAVSLDEEWAPVQGFFGGKIPSGVVRELSGHLVKTYGVSTLPDTYLIGPDGLPILRFSGARDWKGKTAREILKRHLAG